MDKLQCEQNCIHCPVCGHKEQFKKYFEKHIALREKSILFDKEPECQFYLGNDINKIKEIKTGNGIENNYEFSKIYNELVDECKTKADELYVEYIKGLQSKLKSKQEDLRYVKMSINHILNLVKCGFAIDKEKYNRFIKERVKLESEIKNIELEIDRVKVNIELYNECFKDDKDERIITKDEEFTPVEDILNNIYGCNVIVRF